MRDRPSRPKLGLRRARALCLTAVAACAVSAVAVSSAQAAVVPFSAELNYGYADLGINPDTQDTVLLNGQDATINGMIDDGTGAITGGDITFPTVQGELSGAGVTIALDDVTPNSITGTFDPGTGALTANAILKAAVTLTGTPGGGADGTCNYNPIPFDGTGGSTAFSTAGVDPHPGMPFNNPAGLAGITGPGSIAAGSTLPAGTGTATTCALLGAALASTDVDIWLGHNSLPTDGALWEQEFEYGRLNAGLAAGNGALDIVEPANPALYRGTITGDAPVGGVTQSGATMTVPGGVPADEDADGFHFTPITGDAFGNTLTLELTLENNGATGTFNPVTGAMTLGDDTSGNMNGDYSAEINNACLSEHIPLGLSTAKDNSSVFDPAGLDGAPYTAAGLGGTGAVADNWPNLPMFLPNAGGCASLNTATTALPGGMWLSKGIVPPSPPPPSSDPPPLTQTPPAQQAKKCKKGQKLKKGKCVKKKKKKKKKK
jgi:hypothetical protein